MKVAPDLEPLLRPIEWCRFDPKNARVHSERNIKSIETSLSRFGQRKPVVALENGTVVAGNGTLTAAINLGWKSLAVTVFENESEAQAYAIADNRTAELADWDWDNLVDILSIDDIGDVGFMQNEIDALSANSLWEGVEGSEIDRVTEYEKSHIIRIKIPDEHIDAVRVRVAQIEKDFSGVEVKS